MNKTYTKIDWSNIPETITSMGDTNINHLDMSIDDMIVSIEEGEKDEQSV